MTVLMKALAIFVLVYSTLKLIDHALYYVILRTHPDEIREEAAKDPELIIEPGETPEEAARKTVEFVARMEILFMVLYAAAVVIALIALSC